MAHLSIVIEKQMLPNKIFHIDLFISARKHKTTLIFPAAKKCRAGQDFSSACGENLLWLVANLKIRMRNIKDFVSPLKVRKLDILDREDDEHPVLLVQPAVFG